MNTEIQHDKEADELYQDIKRLNHRIREYQKAIEAWQAYQDKTIAETHALNMQKQDLRAERDALRECLKEAWILGSDHRKPTMEQLNKWRETLTSPHRK